MGRKKVIDKSIDPNTVEPGDLTEITEQLSDEVDSLRDEEANQTLPEEASLQDATNVDENTLEAEIVEVGADADDTLPAELNVFTDNQTAKELNKNIVSSKNEVEEKKTDQKNKKVKIKKARSKRYLDLLQIISKDELYSIEEAIDLVKKTANTKFDSTIEAHFKIEVKKTGSKDKSSEPIRGVVKLPSGAVKKPKVVILNEDIAQEIIKTGKVNFDIAISSPQDMPEFGKLAKILGPKGKMPNPKVGTVTDDPQKTKTEIESGQIEYRADSFNIVHLGIGKVSWDNDKIMQNYDAIKSTLSKYKIKSITLASSMGPSVKVKI